MSCYMDCHTNRQCQQQCIKRLRIAFDQPLRSGYAKENRQAFVERQIARHGVTDQGWRLAGMVASCWLAGGGRRPSR